MLSSIAHVARRLWPLVAIVIGLLSCRQAATDLPAPVASPIPPAATSLPVSATLISPPTPTTGAGEPTQPTNLPATAVATPTYTGPISPPCGLILSPLPPTADSASQLIMDDAARAALRSQTPDAAWPALQRLLDAPDTVGLVAYQAGRETEGIYLNADLPMPLASVAKLITLVAYAEAVAAGELNPLEQVRLSELDRYYLPNFDLGAHRRAVNELRAGGNLISPDDDPAVILEDVAWMMIRHSSNAAADYLHLRLGQARIEETAAALGLNTAPATHSAPCTFLGQFLMMANHSRGFVNDRSALESFIAGGATGGQAYGREVALLADMYINQLDFREAEQAFRSSARRPAIETQRYFAGSLAPQGTAGGYAALMRRLAQNGLSNPDSSYQARRILEWPNQFPANQAIFTNVGYKNGSLPGVLTTAYYAYRWDDGSLAIVVLFFRDLPQQTYRQWRNELPHDELARWLLADPSAIPTVAAALRNASGQ